MQCYYINNNDYLNNDLNNNNFCYTLLVISDSQELRFHLFGRNIQSSLSREVRVILVKLL